MPPSTDEPSPRHGGVVLFTEARDWHLRRIRAAFARRGIEPVTVPLRAVSFDLSAPFPVQIPGLGGARPRAVLVRGVTAGSFEAITLRLGVLHALAAEGVPVWNRGAAIERCVDKSAASLAFARAGLPAPPTFVTEDPAAAAAHVAARARPIVLKPLFGSQGKGIRLLHGPDDLPPPDEVEGVYYLQDFVAPTGDGFRDHRVFVSGGRVLAAMTRASDGFVTNMHQGATPLAWTPSAQAAALAVAAVAAVGADFAGVDMIADADGRHLLLEVNSMPSWKGLQSVSTVDIAACLVDNFLEASGLADLSHVRGDA
ncbi:RimK family alpha-L-glutamate ligase [Methylobrevis pamukkalensis]|uniref:Alpha-aminoadipate--LysW ligase LysX n=1 Tax=Methylobrevis pamukkalensis TaxID=1439726 RepID=A0A1E3H4X1_9HYPH|nr:RimK family alpha-L-glutamate ligase [Methylobrevis pamukkalensis]ODN71362.1 Alpha-aminoadipate--LysW ligase LysX [Methylobrevis pamukkalensis]